MKERACTAWEHWPAMVAAAGEVLGDWAEAEDCASTALLAFLDGKHEDVVDVRGLLLTITRRRAVDEVRRRARAGRSHDRAGGGELWSAPDIAEEVASRDEAARADALAQHVVSARGYRVLRLTADDVSAAAVASELGLTRRAVESHLLRARRLVRTRLGRAVALLGPALLSGVVGHGAVAGVAHGHHVPAPGRTHRVVARARARADVPSWCDAGHSASSA